MTTSMTLGTSMPRPATSVATRTLYLSSRKPCGGGEGGGWEARDGWEVVGVGRWG